MSEVGGIGNDSVVVGVRQVHVRRIITERVCGNRLSSVSTVSLRGSCHAKKRLILFILKFNNIRVLLKKNTTSERWAEVGLCTVLVVFLALG